MSEFTCDMNPNDLQNLSIHAGFLDNGIVTVPLPPTLAEMVE